MMWLVDTSVWIDHLRDDDALLRQALQATQVLAHPWVVGEIALGSLKNRAHVLQALQGLPQAVVASPHEVMTLVEAEQLFAKGLGYVDVALLASTRLTPHARLWTRDKRLQHVAQTMGLTANKAH